MEHLPDGTVVRLKPLENRGWYKEVYCSRQMSKMSKERIGGVIVEPVPMIDDAYKIQFTDSNEVSEWTWSDEMFDVIHIPK
jgi:hypothetical protein